ncbi:uncharacterized protein MELLADRAFT_60834 [Melampsora larici-populina 98AG31]|uniref:COP9 signalosome complex subunit 3 n=1 Tax=Melampsora larici-populina (strain 98AG31 / pathotype 3-4-7) TaxID=747676 RepID=F4RCI6_MELLP|nr:uncharacterized protein MELLADRAFT_60834 [Melampsora larici-populina 98AG31]EGG09959.1 hypothetical protein MELLADRAFT_60834 [Melampsora larici-populina 98AG31]
MTNETNPNMTNESNNQNNQTTPNPNQPIPRSSTSSLIELILSKENSIDINYLETLKKIKPEVLICLSEDSPEGEVDVLDEVLDAEIHGFGYFVILSMRLVFGKFKSLEKPIYWLIKKNEDQEVLSALHSLFMKVCLFCGEWRRAIEVSGVDLVKVNRKNHPIDYQDHLIYHYFAGIIQALNRNYKRSIQLLTITVSAPGSFISQIQIEAYKKLILISLLSEAKSPELPKYLNSQFKSYFSKIGKLYFEFVHLFLQSIHSSINNSTTGGFEDEKLLGFVEKNLNVFLQDRNYGLVKLCIEVLPRKKILNLIPIYKSIPIKTISKILNQTSEEFKTIELIQSMITNREIHARIIPTETENQEEGILEFINDSEKSLMNLNLIIQRIKRFESQMKEIEFSIERNPDYLKKTLKELKEMEKPIGSGVGVGVGGNLDTHSGSAQQQFLHQQQIQYSMQMVPVGEEDLGVSIGMENGWDEQDDFK